MNEFILFKELLKQYFEITDVIVARTLNTIELNKILHK